MATVSRSAILERKIRRSRATIRPTSAETLNRPRVASGSARTTAVASTAPGRSPAASRRRIAWVRSAGVTPRVTPTAAVVSAAMNNSGGLSGRRPWIHCTASTSRTMVT